MGRRAEQRGVTFIEIMVTLTILVMSSLWLLGAYHSSLHLSEVSQQAEVAVNDLQDMMERIKTTPFSGLLNDFPNGAINGIVGAGPEQYGAIIGGYALPTEQITVTHSPNVTADPRELIVQVTWTNRGRVYQRTVSTIRASQAS